VDRFDRVTIMGPGYVSGIGLSGSRATAASAR